MAFRPRQVLARQLFNDGFTTLKQENVLSSSMEAAMETETTLI